MSDTQDTRTIQQIKTQGLLGGMAIGAGLLFLILRYSKLLKTPEFLKFD
jgi:hypothetical protein